MKPHKPFSSSHLDGNGRQRRTIPKATVPDRGSTPAHPGRDDGGAFLVQAPVGVFRTSPEGRLLWANTALARMLGYASPAALMSAVKDLAKQVYDDPGERERVLGQVAGGGSWEEVESDFRRADGSRFPVRLRLRALAGPAGQTMGLEGYVVDLSSEAAGWQAFRESEERFAALVENSPLGIFVAGAPRGRILFLNQVAGRVLGLDRDAALSTSILEALAPEERGEIQQALEALTRGQVVGSRTQVRAVIQPGGKRVLGEFTLSPVVFRGTPALQGILRDVTQQEALRRQLQHAQKMESLGTLSSGVAHEFNNLLMAIQGYAQLAMGELEPGAPALKWMERLGEGIGRAGELVSSMLDLSRQEAGKRRPVDLGRLLEGVTRLLSRTLPPEVELAMEADPDLPPVEADPNRLEQVVLNLALNARDAMPRGGRLRLSAHAQSMGPRQSGSLPWARPGTWLVLEVADDGQGIPPEVLPRIFEPFFTTKAPGSGTGLGLAMVHNLVEELGGGVTVESLPGQGSTFKVHLPALAQRGEAPAAEATQAPIPELPPGRVLVVDDEPSLRDIVTQALTNQGMAVDSAPDGAQGLDLYRRALAAGAGYDLVILDWAMPVMGGEAFLAELAREHPEAVVIIATGQGAANISPGQGPPRVAEIMKKPFSLRQLLVTVGQALEAPEPD